MRVSSSAFPDHVVLARFRLADGYCECADRLHGHTGRCSTPLKWQNRGNVEEGGWETHHELAVSAAGSDTLAKSRIYCWESHRKSLEGIQALTESEQ